MNGTPSTSKKAAADELMQVEGELEMVNAELRTLQKRRSALLERKQKLERKLTTDSATGDDHEAWERRECGWSERAEQVLKEVFHLPAFRPLQKATINAVLSGEDTILLMSTGGGKSLCYQLPAVISEGLTLVVSPLISLIEDQLMQLKSIGVEAATLNQSTSKEEVKRIETAITTSKSSFRLLYVTPEKLAKSKRIMNKLEKSLEMKFLKLIAIDEVHCCSQWGHDFRPDYKFLNVLKRQFKGVPILGLTATATGSVLDDVKSMLGIPGAVVFRAGFNRPNLKYEVIAKDSATVDTTLVNLIKDRFPKQSGIVYCFSRKDCEDTAQLLRKNGIRAQFYHAYIEPDDRSKVHQKWISGDYQVIVATVAFGMGIDKPDVRFVIHHSIPKSIENYYQESGRAGRDGKPATCILLWKFQDMFRQSTMVCSEKTGVENLYAVVQYAISNEQCRRVCLSSHFDEPWESEWCQRQCDVCEKKREYRQADITHIAHRAVELISEAHTSDKKNSSGRLTALKLVELLCKGKEGEERGMCERAVVQLIMEKYIQEDYHYTPYSIISYVVEGPNYKRLKNDEERRVFVNVEGGGGERKEPSRKRPTAKVLGDSSDDECTVVKMVKK